MKLFKATFVGEFHHYRRNIISTFGKEILLGKEPQSVKHPSTKLFAKLPHGTILL
jgi:hypothetical protein